jgi:exopolysaccharide biosynthesis polyprenyl glycosylphosphotransferase
MFNTLKALDVALTGLCLLFAAVITHLSDGFYKLTSLMAMRISVRNAAILFFLGIVWHYIFKQMGVYSSRRLSTFASEAWDLVKGTSVIAMVLLILQIIYPMQIITMRTVELFWLFCCGGLVLSRALIRSFLALARKNGRNLRNILIVGSNERAVTYAHKFHSRHSFGYRVVGFVDNAWHGPRHDGNAWCKLVADFKSFADYIQRNVIDEVFIFLPLKSSYTAISQVIEAAEDQGVTVRMALDFFDLRIAQGRIENIEDEPLLTLYTGSMRCRAVVLKEITDRVFAGFLLLLLLPVFACTALAIKLSSPGPVFFRQKRIGQNKRGFMIWKFRTMVPDAHARQKDLEHLNEMGQNAAAFKIKNDPRVTPIGKVLRKYSIDEMPQLINVLVGDMSVVGPRPLTERDYNTFRVHRQIRRFSVKPGITCLWQVNGRNNTSFERWMDLDMQYIDDWSLLLDFKILLRTIPAVFTGHGAS